MELSQQAGIIVQRHGQMRMVRSEFGSKDLDRPPIERFGLRVAPLGSIQHGQVVAGYGDVRMRGSQRRLAHLQ